MAKSNEETKRLEAILKIPENIRCADCDNKTPRWASSTFGTLVCIRCSGFILLN